MKFLRSLVKFYSATCGHCHEFAKIFLQFTKSIKNWYCLINVLAIECQGIILSYTLIKKKQFKVTITLFVTELPTGYQIIQLFDFSKLWSFTLKNCTTYRPMVGDHQKRKICSLQTVEMWTTYSKHLMRIEHIEDYHWPVTMKIFVDLHTVKDQIDTSEL